jgi:hypothetical protein
VNRCGGGDAARKMAKRVSGVGMGRGLAQAGDWRWVVVEDGCGAGAGNRFLAGSEPVPFGS